MGTEKPARSRFLADKIIEFLSRQGRTQRELAKFAGISTGHINNHITGVAYPKIETLIKYARFFGVTLYELTGNEIYRNIEARAESRIPTPEEIALLEKFKSLPPDHWLRKAIDDILMGKHEPDTGGKQDE